MNIMTCHMTSRGWLNINCVLSVVGVMRIKGEWFVCLSEGEV
jgi:hypothetical protein